MWITILNQRCTICLKQKAKSTLSKTHKRHMYKKIDKRGKKVLIDKWDSCPCNFESFTNANVLYFSWWLQIYVTYS